MFKTITALTFGLLTATIMSTQAQNFVEANNLTGFNNPFTGVYGSSIAFSDVNGDGKPDVLITGYNGDNITKLYTNSGTNFTEVLGTPFPGVASSSIAFSDVNSDGNPDVLITGANNSGTIAKLYTNSGDNFMEVPGTSFVLVYWSSIAFSDVNSDGNPDVLITGQIGGEKASKLYTNSGSNFTEVADTPFIGVEFSSIAFSDVNNDGQPDVLITGDDGFGNVISKLYTNSGGNFTEVADTPFIGVYSSSIAFSDVNSDGNQDVLITGQDGSGNGISKLYTNSGSNFTEVADTPFIGVYGSSIAFSDINSDGNPDVLITGQNASNNYIAKLYTNSGSNFTEVANTPFTGVYYSSIAFSDVNSDGNPDVLITGLDTSGNMISKLYINIITTQIITQPESAIVCDGSIQNFIVSAVGTNLNYLWSNGATTTGMATSIAGDYMVTVSGYLGSVVSDVIRLENYLNTYIATQPLETTSICSGLSQNFNISVIGSNLTYAWSNGASTTDMSTSVAGTYYVTVTGECGSVVSDAASLVLNQCETSIIGQESITNKLFTIYPNPTSGSFVIEVPFLEKAELLSYTVTSVEGKIVATGSLTKSINTVDAHLAQGIYFVKVGHSANKLIVE